MTLIRSTFVGQKRLKTLVLLMFSLVNVSQIWYNSLNKNKGENSVNTDTVIISREEYENLLKANAELAQQVKDLSEAVALLRQQRFGSSSEKNKVGDGSEQLSFLFNEPEVYADAAGASVPREPDLTTVKEHTRKKRAVNSEVLPEDVEIELIEKRLEGDDLKCPNCGEEMEQIGETVVRRLKLIPAKAVIVETHTYTYACKKCTVGEDEKTPIVSTKSDPPVIPGSNAAPEAIAFLAEEKFVAYTPLYRLEQILGRQGIPLSRQTMSYWLLRACELYLEPIWDLMRVLLLEEDILHADETTLQVLHELNRKAQTKSYMWLYRTGRYARQQLVLYEYQQTRGAEHPEKFLLGFKGYLHTDGFAGYHKLPKPIRVVGCHSHARRKFVEALVALKEEDRKGTAAERGVQYFDALFALEEKWHDLDPDERKKKRQEFAKPIMDELYDWVFHLNASAKSLLGKAAHYTRAQWQWLVGYLEDGRLEISNNRAERSIKPFVMSRKNFLFANTPSGAKASAIYFSLIETAKENGLDPYRYLTWLLKIAPTLNMKDCDQVEKLLPMNAPEDCQAGKRVVTVNE